MTAEESVDGRSGTAGGSEARVGADVIEDGGVESEVPVADPAVVDIATYHISYQRSFLRAYTQRSMVREGKWQQT